MACNYTSINSIKANNQEFEFNNYLGFLEKVINKY